MKGTDRNYSIDLFRLLGAFSVVIIHAKYGTLSTNAISNILAINIRLLSRWAVPFFFLISGFYLEKRFKLSTGEPFFKSLINLISISIIANFIFIVFLLFTNPGSLIQLLDLKNYIGRQLSAFVVYRIIYFRLSGTLVFGEKAV